MDVDALLPRDVARRAEAVGVAKVGMPVLRAFVLAVLAGAFISLGAVFATVVTAGGGTPPGVARLLGGLVFSLGLVLVVVAGAELFTGNALVVMAAASRRVRVRALLRNWLIVYAGNFVGALLTTAALVRSGIYERGDGAVGVRALDIAATKTSLAWDEAILLGVFANALVCLAVWLSLSARSVTDKVLAVVFPVSAFVAAGFEHSIANMYFVPAGLFLRAWAPSDFWATAGVGPGDYPSVTWHDFLVGNLVPVTIGNVIGGALLVGLVYWFVYLHGSAGPDHDGTGPNRAEPTGDGRHAGPSALSRPGSGVHREAMTADVSPGSDKVSLLIGAPVAKVRAEANLRDVAAAMVERCVGALVVGERHGPATGIVSERDLVRALAEARDPLTTRASDIASTGLLWCDADATIAEVATEMMDAYVRHILVEEGGRLVGIVSARDVLGAYATADVDDT